MRSRNWERPILMPDIFTGKGDIEEYLAHFELVAQINNWTSDAMAKYLAVSLRGDAQQVLRFMNGSQCYESLKDALMTRFKPGDRRQIHRAQLRKRVRHDNENLADLAHAIRVLVSDSFPTLEAYPEAMESLCLEHFVDALSDREMRLKIMQSRPKTMYDAMSLALELENLSEAERIKHGDEFDSKCFVREESTNEVKSDKKGNAYLEPKVNDLQRALEDLKIEVKLLNENISPRNQPRNKNQPCCFRCNEKGHKFAYCPY